jgi:hypothetical protein
MPCDVLFLLTVSFQLDLNWDGMVEVEALGGHDIEQTHQTHNVHIVAYEVYLLCSVVPSVYVKRKEYPQVYSQLIKTLFLELGIGTLSTFVL